MDSPEVEVEGLEEKVRSQLEQLKLERAIFERLVYKNKNQHRRSSYFQYLLKVRRDLRLLQSAKLEELLNSCFNVITGRSPKQKVHLLESLKRRRCDGEVHNFLDRLLGAARLLSQMVEPMLRAATEVSTLLAQSFFMGFSLTILALLARLRVLVQQILLDFVSIFNAVSSLSQKKQSIKINQEGIEVYREFYPTNKEYTTLECVWDTDKFKLLEQTHKSEIGVHGSSSVNNVITGSSAVRYQSLEAFLGDDEPRSKKVDANHLALESPSHIMDVTAKPLAGPSAEKDVVMQTDRTEEIADGPGTSGTLAADHTSKYGSQAITPSSPSSNLPSTTKDGSLAITTSSPSSNLHKIESPSTVKDGSLAISTSSPSSNLPKVESRSRKVAFVSVKRPTPSTPDSSDLMIREAEKKTDVKEDKFYNLLTGGNLKDSLF